MSHIAVVESRIKDIDSFEIACDRKNADLRRDQTTFDSFTRSTCDHAIRVRNSNAFEAGLILRPDGDGYDIGFDDYGQRGQALVRAFGLGLVDLKNEYLAVVSERYLRTQGHMVQRVVEGDEIVLRAYA